MENLSYDALVELVTKEVLNAIGSGACASDKKINNSPLALVVGNSENLPKFALDKYSFENIESYDGNIEKYECLFLDKLTCADLADCALGRDCRTVPCAFTKAMLNGKKVYLLETALPHRKYKATANRAFFSSLEGYVNTLRSFGVEIIREQWYGKNLDRNAIADNSVDKVITEKIAVSLVENCPDGLVKLLKGTVITPSAKDIFNHSQVKVEFVD